MAKRKVEYFSVYSGRGIELERKINNFAETHNIVQISYSCHYNDPQILNDHHCMVLYEDEE